MLCQLWVQPFSGLEISVSYFFEASYVVWSITTRPSFFKKPNPCEEEVVWGLRHLTSEWGSHLMWYIHNRIPLSHKKNKRIPFVATWMNLEIIILNGVCQTKTNIIWYHLHVESKICHKWTYLWNRNRLISIGLWLTRRVGWGIEWKFRASGCKLLYTRWINRVLMYSTENYIQYPMINHMQEYI